LPASGATASASSTTYSEELAEYEERTERIDPVVEIEKARALVWPERDPSSGELRWISLSRSTSTL
jgi:hypothetical protein